MWYFNCHLYLISSILQQQFDEDSQEQHVQGTIQEEEGSQEQANVGEDQCIYSVMLHILGLLTITDLFIMFYKVTNLCFF